MSFQLSAAHDLRSHTEPVCELSVFQKGKMLYLLVAFSGMESAGPELTTKFFLGKSLHVSSIRIIADIGEHCCHACDHHDET
jgi:hypothetical protein